MRKTDELVLSGWAETPAVRGLVGMLRIKGLGFRFEPFPLLELRRMARPGGEGHGPRLRVDGRTVVGARAIRDFLEDHQPQPPLRPRDISAAAWCYLLEDWAEEALAGRIALLRWLVPAHRERAAAAAVASVPALLRPALAETCRAAMRLRLRARGQTAADVPAAEAALRRISTSWIACCTTGIPCSASRTGAARPTWSWPPNCRRSTAPPTRNRSAPAAR